MTPDRISNYRDRKKATNRIISEIYSPPRVTAAISSIPNCNLVLGFALHITCVDPDDRQPWNFDLQHKRANARRMFEEQQPILLIGSPMCCDWL